MTGYIIRRLLATIPVMLVVAVSVFLMVHLTPGDPAAIIAGGQKASFEQIEAIREQMGAEPTSAGPAGRLAVGHCAG